MQDNSTKSEETLPEKIGFPSGTLYERPIRLDVLAAQKGVFVAIDKPADVLLDSYLSAPQIPLKKSDFVEPQLASIVVAMRKQLGKAEYERIGLDSPYAASQCDFENSGVAIVALNKDVSATFRNAVWSGAFKFEYTFLARKNTLLGDSIVADLPIVKNENRNAWTVSHRFGRKSKTEFTLIETAGDFQLWKATAETIRPHQVRLHAAEKGFKIIGENLYSRGGQVFLSQIKGNFKLKKSDEFERPIYPHLFLHLNKITFDAAKLDMPELNVVEIESPLPKNFAICLKKLKFKLDAQ